MGHHLHCFIYLTNLEYINQIQLFKFGLNSSNQYQINLFIYKIYTTHDKLGILLFTWVLFLFGLNFNEISKSSLWYY